MDKNARIDLRLEDCLNILDARAYIDLFIKLSDNKDALLRSAKVYELLTDKDFRIKYRNYNVVGLSRALNTTSILIEEV